MPTSHEIDAPLNTVKLLRSLGDEGSRLNSRGKVRFANCHGNGETFHFGDRVFVVDVGFGQTLVVRA